MIIIMNGSINGIINGTESIIEPAEIRWTIQLMKLVNFILCDRNSKTLDQLQRKTRTTDVSSIVSSHSEFKYMLNSVLTSIPDEMFASSYSSNHDL